jgi:hypothetical protein
MNEQDTAEMMATRVRQHLQNLAMAPEEWAPYIFHLLGMQEGKERLAALSSQAIRTRIFETLLQMSIQTSQQQPLLVAVEDLHWIDPTSEEWLTLLVERLAGVPILALTSYRSGYHAPWMDKSYVTQLALQRLTTDDSRRLVQAVFHPTTVPEPLMLELLTKASGNPFFLEELAQAVVEHGATHSPLTIPETVQTVLAARMDRLPPGAKYLLQVASVIGTEIPIPLLQVVSGLSDTALQQHLRSLQGTEFLFATRSLPACAYTFKHALTQEAAYQSLLRRTRQQVHQRTAQMLVEHFAATVATQPEVVAHHYTAAGLGEQAVPYWYQAGQQANERSAYVEAIRHLTQGLAVLATLPATLARAQHEIEFQYTLSIPLLTTKGSSAPEIGEALARARELCEYVGDTAQLFKVLVGLWRFRTVRGEFQSAQALSKQLAGIAQREPATFRSWWVEFSLGFTRLGRGELVLARESLERARRLQEAREQQGWPTLGAPDEIVLCCAHLAMVLGVLGYPDQAWSCAYHGLARARATAHPYDVAHALVHVGWMARLQRDVVATQAAAEELIALCQEQHFAQWLPSGLFYRGWGLMAQGHSTEGLAWLRQGMACRLGGPFMWAYDCALLAEACLQAGQPAEGLRILTEALEFVQHSEGRFYTAELYRLQGELLLAQKSHGHQGKDHQWEDPEAYFQHALTLARCSQAKWWELRAAVSLSRLWQRQGKRQAAHASLAPVYGWFTEGFDTADLQEARALLHELQ